MQPLVTEEPPNRNPRDPGEFKIRFATANAGTSLEPGFEHLLFEANDTLTDEVPGIAPEAPEVGAGAECTQPGSECNLYEWQEGQLALVNVLPGDSSATLGGVIGAGRLLAETQHPDVSHAISDDGSRIFWSAEQTGEVYVRVDGGQTLEIPTPDPGTCKESELPEDRVCFLTASADGTAVLLSDGQVYELNGAGSAYEATTDLTDGKGGFEGIAGAAEDLSRIYFVDTAALTEAGEENENGEHAEAGKLNLYGWDEGALAFIGILLPGDGEFGVLGTTGPGRPPPRTEPPRSPQTAAIWRSCRWHRSLAMTTPCAAGATAGTARRLPAARSSSTQPTPTASPAPPATRADNSRWGPRTSAC